MKFISSQLRSSDSFVSSCKLKGMARTPEVDLENMKDSERRVTKAAEKVLCDEVRAGRYASAREAVALLK